MPKEQPAALGINPSIASDSISHHIFRKSEAFDPSQNFDVQLGLEPSNLGDISNLTKPYSLVLRRAGVLPLKAKENFRTVPLKLTIYFDVN